MLHALAILTILAAGLLVLRCAWVAATALFAISRSMAILATLYIAWAASSEQEALQEAAGGIIGSMLTDDEPDVEVI